MMFTLALFFAGVVSANAERIYADLSQYGDKWDGNVLTFSWTAPWGNQLGPNLDQIGLPKGDLRSWEKLVVVVDENGLIDCDYFRILVYSGEDSSHNDTFKATKTGVNEFTLSGGVQYLDQVTRICLSGSSGDDSHSGSWPDNPSTFKVKEVYLERPDVTYITEQEVIEAPEGTTDLKNLTGTEANWANTVTYPKEFAVQGNCFGNGDGSNESTHVDIEGYDYISFFVTTAPTNSVALRIWIWNGSSVVTLFAHPIENYETADYTQEHRISAPGTYVAKVTGYKDLKGVKAANNWGATSITVSMAWMSTGAVPVAYSPSGKTTLVGSEALNDPTITGFNVTALSSTNLTLEAANPNALFIANEGTLANDKNVIVDGTCANLVLTDGFAFKAPVDFTATEASYTTTINAEAGAGTLCLPFDAALPEGVVAYDLNYTAGDAYATKTPVNAITANAPVLINGTGDATFTGAGEVKAGAENINGALTGIFAEGNVPTGSYVLQNGEKGLGFYLVDEEAPITIKPFRAYLTADGAEVRSLGIVLGGETTAIKSVAEAEGEGAIYSLSGVRISQPTRGIYVKNGKKVVVK